MKTYKLTLAIIALFCGYIANAQRYGGNNTATVVAQNYDISDNLDLQAVASLFGDSNDLEDFERRLNDPSAQISNLDLNRDGYVDYLRVIETADNDARIIVIQSVLGDDTFQDVATIELERQRSANNSTVHVQIVGNPYLYGANYIYEPFYWRTPIFFDYFWLATYRPYFSPWYWGYYPAYYTYWAPMPVYRYHRHITPYINTRNSYVYTNNRRITNANRIYSNVSRSGFERSNPNRSFTQRNQNVTNRYALDQTRNQNNATRQVGTRNNTSVQNTRSTINNRVNTRTNNVRSTMENNNRSTGIMRATTTVRNNGIMNRNTNSTNSVRSTNNSTRIERAPRYNNATSRSTSTSNSRGSFNTGGSFNRSSSMSSGSMRSGSSMSTSRGGGFSGGGRSGGSSRGR